MPSEADDTIPGPGAAAHRQELIANTEGMDISTAGFQVRISNVPLFRSTRSGLRQAVRLRLSPSATGSNLGIRIGDGQQWLDEIAVSTTHMRTEFLTVPEVTEDTELTIELFDGAAVLASEVFMVRPQRKWTVHLVHHSHYDIGYTDPQTLVMESQLAFIDDALELASSTDDWPEDARFRWSIEVNWPLKHWLRTRSGAARAELVRRVREHRFEINALPFSMHTEAFSFDELARQFDTAQQLRDELGVDIVTAMQTDVPGSTIGLATLLTDAGIRFLAVAHNYAGRSIPHLLDGQDLTRPFYWQAPDGERVLVWYTDTLHGSAYMEAMSIGFGDGYDDVLMGLPEYLNALAQRNYPYGGSEDWIAGSLLGVESRRAGYPFDLLHLRVQGAYGDNAPPSRLPAEIIREWNDTWAFPRLVSSTNQAFLEAAEAQLGEQLATYTGDWTDWWADGIGSSASVLAKNRASQSGIRTAQTLNALADMLGDDTHARVNPEVAAAYEEMALFDEHTWGAADPWGKDLDRLGSGETQWMRKAGFALAAEERVTSLLRGGAERLAPLALGSRDVTGESLAVFNPSSWARTDLVRIFIPRHAWSGNAASLIEADTGRSIPFIIQPQAHDHHRPLGVWIQFLSENVPAIGYIRYLLAPGTEIGPTPASNSAAAGNSFENSHFTVTLDLEHGSIGSIRDHAAGWEVVDQAAPFGFNGYIHDRYTSGTGFNHLSSRMGRAQPWLLGTRGTGSYGLITSREDNAVFTRVTYRQTGQGADWIETILTMPHGAPRLMIANRFYKPAVMEKESVYFAFPFAGIDPVINYEITGGVASPGSPHVPGSARHFRAIRHWATIESQTGPTFAWATNQAPLVQTGNIHLPYAPFPATIPPHLETPGTIYSWALNNIWDTNFPPQQGGELGFDYVIATAKEVNPHLLAQDAAASATQPMVGLRARQGTAPLQAADRGSFVSVEDPRVEVTHLSIGRNGELVMNIESHAPGTVQTDLVFNGMLIASAEVRTFIDTHEEPLPVRDNHISLTIQPGALIRVALQIGSE